MIGVVLDIQSDECHGNSIDNGQSNAGLLHPTVLQIKEQGNVADSTEKVPWSAKLFSSSDYSKDLLFDFSLELCVKLIP
jgi:hypothetical protein